jgi:hypothetical protein
LEEGRNREGIEGRKDEWEEEWKEGGRERGTANE